MRQKRKWCVSTPPRMHLSRSQVNCVGIFTYLGSVISRDEIAQKGIKNRLSKARNAYGNLRPVCRSSVYSIRTKLHLYNSIIKSVLLYGSECWQVVEKDFYKIKGFHNGCQRRICLIFWISKHHLKFGVSRQNKLRVNSDNN